MSNTSGTLADLHRAKNLLTGEGRLAGPQSLPATYSSSGAPTRYACTAWHHFAVDVDFDPIRTTKAFQALLDKFRHPNPSDRHLFIPQKAHSGSLITIPTRSATLTNPPYRSIAYFRSALPARTNSFVVGITPYRPSSRANPSRSATASTPPARLIALTRSAPCERVGRQRATLLAPAFARGQHAALSLRLDEGTQLAGEAGRILPVAIGLARPRARGDCLTQALGDPAFAAAAVQGDGAGEVGTLADAGAGGE